MSEIKAEKELRLIFRCANCGTTIIKTSTNSLDQRYIEGNCPLEGWIPNDAEHPINHKCIVRGVEIDEYGFIKFVGFRVVEVVKRVGG